MSSDLHRLEPSLKPSKFGMECWLKWDDPDMPKLPQPLIEVAWRHSGEVGKIHYRAKRPDGTNRHLIARDGDALYELLEQHLSAIGYIGPKSTTESSEAH